MLAFILFFASVIVPFLLIGGLIVIAHQQPAQPGQLRPQLRPLSLPVPSRGEARLPHYDVPSSLLQGETWHVYLN